MLPLGTLHFECVPPCHSICSSIANRGPSLTLAPIAWALSTDLSLDETHPPRAGSLDPSLYTPNDPSPLRSWSFGTSIFRSCACPTSPCPLGSPLHRLSSIVLAAFFSLQRLIVDVFFIACCFFSPSQACVQHNLLVFFKLMWWSTSTYTTRRDKPLLAWFFLNHLVLSLIVIKITNLALIPCWNICSRVRVNMRIHRHAHERERQSMHNELLYLAILYGFIYPWLQKNVTNLKYFSHEGIYGVFTHTYKLIFLTTSMHVSKHAI